MISVRRCPWLTMLLLVSASCHAEKQLPAAADFIGTWRIVSIAGYADMGGGEPLGKEMIGTKLTVTPQGMALDVDKWSCVAEGGYRVQEVDMAYLLEDSGAKASEVGLPARAVRLSDSNGCLQIFWLSSDMIEFDFTGVFVRARRI